MEWTVPINDILSDEITKLNCTLVPPSFLGDVRSLRLVQQSLSKAIDTLGELSAVDQGLSKIITTAEKLRNTPTHLLYLLKDPAAKGGKGEVIGLLKIGRKHLFLFDEQDKVCEVEPLCVLDFYIQKDRQRHGYGKILFDHMLKDNGVVAQELAIDGPSSKMEQFLRRGYGVDRLLRQNNNFAVAPEFFTSIANINKSGQSTPVITPAVGRFAAPKPHSSIANVIHGGGTPFQQTNGLGRRSEITRSTLRMNTSGAATPELHNTNPTPATKEPEKKETVEPPADEQEKPDGEEPEKKSPERPSTLSVEPITETAASAPSPAGSTMSRRDSQLTDRGYFDVKFYHNKLW